MLRNYGKPFLTTMYLGVCVLGILGASVSIQHSSSGKFYFTRSQYRRLDECNVCYNADCVNIDQVRCDYYMETQALIKDEDSDGFPDPQLRRDVDDILFDIVEKEISNDMECIPYLSRYTDCDKENICIGCKVCHCSYEGKWNCTSSSDCRNPLPAIPIDHKVLSVVIKNILNGVQSNKQKRSVSYNSLENSNLTFLPEGYNDWFYEDETLQTDPTSNRNTRISDNLKLEDDIKIDVSTETVAVPVTEHIFTAITKESTMTTESDYIVFDEVLDNIAIDNKNYIERKSLLPLYNKTVDFDYMLSEDDITYDYNNTKNKTTEILHTTNLIPEENGVTEPNLDNVTNIVIDLLKSVKKDNVCNKTDFMYITENKNNCRSFDNINNVVDYNYKVNLIKRDISRVLTTTNAPNNINNTKIKIKNNATVIEHPTKRINGTNLKTNVLLPLIKIINTKGQELADLGKIKKNLISFMASNNQSPVVEILDYPNISATNMLHDLEMFPDLEYDLRRINPNTIDKLIYKLKVDIYEVIKDIVNLQKNQQGEIHDDLDKLIKALKQYAHGNKTDRRDLLIKNSYDTQFTRHFSEQNRNKYIQLSFKQCIIKVLQTMNKKTPNNNAIGFMSRFSRRIIQHIIGVFYTDESNVVELNEYDLGYNLTKDLKIIGSKWQDITNNIIGSSPFMTLYRMKLLHLYLETDINKISSALALIDFAHNRRMIPNFHNVQNSVIDQMDEGFKSIYNKIQIIVKSHTKKPEIKQGQRKHSFIERIRNLLRSSKGDIDQLFHKQVSKPEIIKQLALKKLNDMARIRYLEYENAMKRWQKALGVMPRYKRNLMNVMSDRIKNIIPRYFRHKVDPKLHENRKVESHTTKYKKEKKKIPGYIRHKK